MQHERIDSHQHFWIKPQPDEYIWMGPDHRDIMHDFLPGDLEPILKRNKINRTVAVQAAVTEKEAEFLFQLADENPIIAGVVIWMDMESPLFGNQLHRYRQHTPFKGIRPMIALDPDVNWMLHKQVKASFRLLAEWDVCFDFLVFPRHLPNVLKILDEFKGLRAVIDHIGNPSIKNREWEPWATLMKHLASHENVYCKLSGMISQADHLAWRSEDFSPYIRYLAEVFEPERLMFGSDWPPCQLLGGYDRMFEALLLNLEGLTTHEQDDVLGNTACKFYRLT